jgi:hypothetical protein
MIPPDLKYDSTYPVSVKHFTSGEHADSSDEAGLASQESVIQQRDLHQELG